MKEKNNKTPENESILEMQETLEGDVSDAEVTVDASLEKAIDLFRRVREQNGPLSDKELSNLDKECDVIRNRETITSDVEHEIMELSAEGKILMGPPILTRFEKARIMGARALQLSLGAPPFIEIPKDARISLDISMEELEKKVIPITIRRVLPNGDYQNIPIDYFQ